MYKIFGLIGFGGVGLLYSAVLSISYLVGLLYLIFTEIIGTKKFMVRFKKLNKIIFEEFIDTIKTFKLIFELV